MINFHILFITTYRIMSYILVLNKKQIVEIPKTEILFFQLIW